MSGNFDFLKKINSNLFEIINDAEKLYQDEYFEQSITQTRRFAEQLCKSMLEQNNKKAASFDEMIEILKENTTGSIQEKEFIDDLYFIKKNGNNSVHSGRVNKNAFTALECLKRCFEICINYCVYTQGASDDILKFNYDVELLITNKKSKKTLKEKYEEKKAEYKNNKADKKSTVLKKENNFKIKKDFKISLFWKFVIGLTIVSGSLILFIFLNIFIMNFKQP